MGKLGKGDGKKYDLPAQDVHIEPESVIPHLVPGQKACNKGSHGNQQDQDVVPGGQDSNLGQDQAPDQKKGAGHHCGPGEKIPQGSVQGKKVKPNFGFHEQGMAGEKQRDHHRTEMEAEKSQGNQGLGLSAACAKGDEPFVNGPDRPFKPGFGIGRICHTVQLPA